MVWTAGPGPVVLQGPVTVAAGTKLIVGPGTQILFENSGATPASLSVSGTFEIHGTAAAPVTLTSPSAGSWNGISAGLNSVPVIDLDHVSIEDVTNGIVITNVSGPQGAPKLTVRNSSIKTLAGPGTAIDVNNLNVSFLASNVDIECGGSGPSVGLRLEVYFSADYADGSVGGACDTAVSLRGSWQVTSPSTLAFARILRNTITTSNAGAGVAVDINTTANQFANSHHVVYGNTITGFFTGVQINRSLAGGTVGVWPTPAIRFNDITSNTRNIALPFGQGDLVVDAAYNYWGSTTPSTIAAGLIVGNGGVIDFTPFLTEGGDPENAPIERRYVQGRYFSEDFDTSEGAPDHIAVGPLVAPTEGPSDVFIPMLDLKLTSIIPQGVTIRMEDDLGVPYGIDTYGKLVVSGDEFDKARLCAQSCGGTGAWPGITVHPRADNSIVNHLILEDAITGIAIIGEDQNPVTGFAINDSTIQNVSTAGLEFSGATGATVTQTTIDNGGTANEGLGHGINVIANGFDINEVDIHDSTIANMLAGLYVFGESDIELGKYPPNAFPFDSTITGNTWGVWLQGEPTGGTPEFDVPTVAMAGNDLSGNTRVYAPSGVFPPPRPPANLRLTDFPTDYAGTIVARNNYWGFGTVNDIANVLGTIHQDRPEWPIVVDAAFYLNSVGGAVNGTGLAQTSGYVAVATTRDVIRPTQGGADASVDILFTPKFDGSVTVRVCPETSASCTSATEIWNSGAIAVTDGTPESVTWNGTNSTSGLVVGDEAYEFALESTDFTYDPIPNFEAPGTQGVFRDRRVPNPQWNQYTQPELGPGICCMDVGDTCPMIPPFEMNAAENEFHQFFYYARGENHRIHLRVRLDPSGTPMDIPIPLQGRPILPDMIPTASDTEFCEMATTNQLAVWDGRDHNGALVPSVLDGTAELEISIPVPERLSANAIIVTETSGRIYGPDLGIDPDYPTIEVRPNPFRITHSYDQPTTMTYCVDQAATVDIKLLNPDEHDPGAGDVNVQEELVSAQSVVADVCETVEWIPDADDIKSLEDGIRTFVIEATNPSHTHLTSTYRGVLQIVQ